MFTVIFAVSRTIGWISQWKEMTDDNNKTQISRPRQLYIGEKKRVFKKISERSLRTNKQMFPNEIS